MHAQQFAYFGCVKDFLGGVVLCHEREGSCPYSGGGACHYVGTPQAVLGAPIELNQLKNIGHFTRLREPIVGPYPPYEMFVVFLYIIQLF